MKTLSTDLEDNNDVSLLLDLGAITPKIKKRRRILPAAANIANTNINNNNNTNRHAGPNGRSLTNNSYDHEKEQLVAVEDRADKVSIHSGAIRNPTNTNTDDDGSNSNVETNFMIPSLQYLCEQQPTESSTSQSSFCDCENFDFELQKGIIDCNLPENETPYCSSTINSCGEEVEICYYNTIHLEAIGVGDDYFYRTCLTYTRPYQQQICTTFTTTMMSSNNTSSSSSTPSPQIQVTNNSDRTPTVTGIEYYEQQTTTTGSCDVTFNNKQCNSCEIEIREYELGDNIYYNRCFEINCGTNGNDNDNTIINTCDNGDSSPNSGVSTLKDNIIFGDDCTKCQPCGIGYYMKNLMGVGIFPIIGEYTCSGLELGSKIGFFDRELCEEIQSQTNIYCDCQPLFTTVVSNENENETEPQSPSFAGGTVSSTEPEPEPKKEIEPEAATETETIDPPLFVLPGDTINSSMCHVCGSNNNSAADDSNSNSNSNSKVVTNVNNPNMILNLPNSSVPTTCLSLEAAGRLGFFSSDYCTDIIQRISFQWLRWRRSTSTSTTPAVVAAINTTTTLMIAEEESKISAGDNVPPPPLTTTIQDNHPISCFVCDPDSELRLQNDIVPLDEDEDENEDATSLSCSEFENALIQVNSRGRTRMNFKTGKIFVTEKFCLEKAHLIAKKYCGGCILKAEEATTPTTAATTSLSSDYDNDSIVQSLVNDALKVAGDEEKGIETEENNNANNNNYKYYDDYDDDNVIMGRDGGGVNEGGVGVENEIIENENNYDNGNSKKMKPLPRFYRDVPEEINVGEDATNGTTTSHIHSI
ncbi:hypothetical protein FRACYDRAFT_251885 [Fragilariopsis cylindrus CCMP1102]|uniref:Uncharacterized protein n=1 Tax=Fragilariopsis cylindrus CCMP1102 TaxID=635003 RepID=A0A1E7EMF2_9STRA|nr:hypothetical protein FRACYDRAFT_251885 [Fragilariopsis cylindrus CCMP1102]|eukprot:OEU07122.1 hypothetical protein FRACYDRAFT_251885 [Fragilariopsis cylindrus CCMP1102]